MGTSYQLRFAPALINIVYLDFTGQLFSPCRSCVWFLFKSIWTSFELVFRIEI